MSGIVQKRWVFTVFVIPGIALVVLVPEKIGALPVERQIEISFYPEFYDGTAVKNRIDQLNQLTNSSGSFGGSPSSFPSTSNASSLNDLATTSVAAWKGAKSNTETTAELQKQIRELEQRPTQKCFKDYAAWHEIRVRLTSCDNSPTKAQIDSQLQPLRIRVQELARGTDVSSNFVKAVSATTAAVVELNAVEKAITEKRAFAGAIPYFFSASISFVFLIYMVGFRNSTVVILLGGTLAIASFSHEAFSRYDYLNDASVVLYPVFICGVSAFLLRFLFRAFIDNFEIGCLFKKSKICVDLLIMAVVWLPFPIFVAGVICLNLHVNKFIADSAYCHNTALGLCPSDRTDYPIVDSDLTKDTLRDDLHSAVFRQFAKFEAQAIADAELARPNTEQALDATRARIMDTVFKQILPPNIYDTFPELTPPSTKDYVGWFYFWPQLLAKKIAFEQINKAYQAPRNRLETRLSARLTEIRAGIANQVGNSAEALKTSIKGEAALASAHLNKSIDSVFLFLNSFAVLQMALMLLVIIRAYLLGFGRILYRSKDEPADPVIDQIPSLALTHVAPSPGKSPKVISEPDDYQVDKQYLPLIAKRSWSANNAKHTTIPIKSFLTRWPIRRLQHGCLLLRKVIHNSTSPLDVTFTSPAARHFVVWTIPPHNRVYFHWKQFVAVSETVQVGKDITLRIGALTMGTVMHSYAETDESPGLLIQVSVGQVILSEKNQSSGAPSQWMSWEDSAKFRIVSSTAFTAMYLDPPQLEPERKTRAALDVDYGASWGLVGWLLRVFRP